MKLYVGNLAPEVTENDLESLFAKHGEVKSVKIIKDMFTQVSKGFGFVEMPDQKEATAAMEEFNTLLFKNKKLVVNEARPEKSGPRNNSGGQFRSGGRDNRNNNSGQRRRF